MCLVGCDVSSGKWLCFIHIVKEKDFFISSHDTKLFEQTTAYSGMRIYNKLSSEIKSIKAITKFKKILNFYSKRVLIWWKNL